MRGAGALVSALISAIGPTGFAVGTGVVVGLALLTIASRLLTPLRVPVLCRA